jgi:hypothetical protein
MTIDVAFFPFPTLLALISVGGIKNVMDIKILVFLYLIFVNKFQFIPNSFFKLIFDSHDVTIYKKEGID